MPKMIRERVVTRRNQNTVQSWIRRHCRVSIYQHGPTRPNGNDPALFRLFDGESWLSVFDGDHLKLSDLDEDGHRHVSRWSPSGGAL